MKAEMWGAFSDMCCPLVKFTERLEGEEKEAPSPSLGLPTFGPFELHPSSWKSTLLLYCETNMHNKLYI